MREKRALAWRHLSLNERDVLTVLSAVCKVGDWPPKCTTDARVQQALDPFLQCCLQLQQCSAVTSAI